MKKQVQEEVIIRELKTGRRFTDLYEFFSLCSGQLWLFLQLVLLRIIMNEVRINIFQGNLGPVLGKLVSLIFHKKIPLYIIQCSYQALRYSIAYIDENC